MKLHRKQFFLLAGSVLIPIVALAAEPTAKAEEPPRAADQTQPMSPSKPAGPIESTSRPGTTGPSGAGVSPAGERPRMTQSEEEKKRLETALQPGQAKSFYREELVRLGYDVTSVNKDRPDYVEYEIVKSARSYEVQIDVDKESGKATKVAIAPNVWRARGTQQAIDKQALR